jgi:hypothetical protein
MGDPTYEMLVEWAAEWEARQKEEDLLREAEDDYYANLEDDE